MVFTMACGVETAENRMPLFRLAILKADAVIAVSYTHLGSSRIYRLPTKLLPSAVARLIRWLPLHHVHIEYLTNYFSSYYSVQLLKNYK